MAKNKHQGEFYKVAAGLTSTRGVHEHGEIVSHRDMGEGFEPLSPKTQEQHFGRVMYEKHEPSEEERARMGLGDVDDEDLEEEDEEVIEAKQLKNMTEDELWQMAQAEGLEFPRGAPRSTVEGALAKKLRDRESRKAKR
ncbi:MAG TPA: hypothetical protein VK667_07765 [Ktedonobacteraceae bacterium]|nr:hypothetical protein [Ktedonobacteraceae bacterium]